MFNAVNLAASGSLGAGMTAFDMRGTSTPTRSRTNVLRTTSL